LWAPFSLDPAVYLFHQYTLSLEEKVVKANMKLKEWGLA